MTIHYHGTPITPFSQLALMGGEHFCVSFANKEQCDTCLTIGQSVLLDNGAFTAFTKGREVDEEALYDWLEPRLAHPHRAVVLDEIGGDVEAQRRMVSRWPFAKEVSFPVWHLDKPISYLMELVNAGWSGVCLGSAGEYWEIGSQAWTRRMNEVFDFLEQRGPLPWLHGLRMSAQCEDWPLASVDSTNIARNHAGASWCPACKSKEINRKNFRARKPVAEDFFLAS